MAFAGEIVEDELGHGRETMEGDRCLVQRKEFP